MSTEQKLKRDIFLVTIPKLLMTIALIILVAVCLINIYGVISFYLSYPRYFGSFEFLYILFIALHVTYFMYIILLMWGAYKPRQKGKIILSIFSGAVIITDCLFVAFALINYIDYKRYIYALFFLAVIGLLFSASLIWNIVKPRIRYPAVTALLLCFVFYTSAEYIAQERERNADVVSLTLDLGDYEPLLDDTKAVSLTEPSTLKLYENFPRMDGATAFYPIYSAFARAVYSQDEDYRHWSSDTIRCSTTEYAYLKLIKGEVDIIFTFGPSREHMALAEEKGVTLELTPIGKEAFVFFVNAENPVNNLTADEVKAIYSGQITNWRRLGGKNKKIRAYQREPNSGSQTTMLDFMGNIPLMNPPTEDIKIDMMGIIDAVSDYRNHDNSIGYSFRFYSSEMVNNNSIKHLSIDGIPPTKQTVADGSYPLTYEFYAITAGTQNPNVPALIEWILSEQGQYIISETGYVPIN